MLPKVLTSDVGGTARHVIMPSTTMGKKFDPNVPDKFGSIPAQPHLYREWSSAPSMIAQERCEHCGRKPSSEIHDARDVGVVNCGSAQRQRIQVLNQ